MSVLPLGAELNGLRIEQVAATGGSSVVYRATDMASGQPRALKVLSGPLDEQTRRSFLREAALLQQAPHPAVVRLHATGEFDGALHLVTDWVEGQTLAHVLTERGALPLPDVMSILDQLSAPLDALHKLGFLHRDLTPSNVMLADDGQITIIDLGIGHEVDAATMTRDDLVAGTPRFLAPEIIRGEGASAQADQYSVAMMVYEMLAGRPALPEANDLATVLHHQLHTVPDPVEEVNPVIPAGISRALERALAKDPADRFASLGAMALAARSNAPARRRSRAGARTARLVGASLVGALCLVALVAWLSARPGAEPADVATPAPTSTTAPPDPQVWVAGTAASLQCNLLAGIDFEDGVLPTDFYGVPAGVERIVNHGGLGDSAVLQLGQAGQFSQYAEWVPVVPGGAYVFRGWFQRTGPLAAAELGIAFLDVNEKKIGEGVKTPIVGTTPGFVEVNVDAAPAGSVFALPYLYKDASQEVLLADELVFGPTSRCVDEFAAFDG